ncbi:MAG: hypothetical protein LBO02_02755 [Holosporaceae bacterium]|jgi:Flp pilus assembly protein CpaB|nr:hypothetical protein [Holosporaceae bacterium]
MNSKKDILPIVIASVIALVITGVVRLLLPAGSSDADKHAPAKRLSMPDIPLVVKEVKPKENQVLVVSGNIKKDEKIILDKLTWKKWPKDAMQPYFIAKDDSGMPLNNVADFDNALKKWAASDIPSGVPLTMAMLSDEDPKKKAEAENKKRQELKKKQAEKVKSSAFIRKGMRAVTFSIDQKSASSSSMLSPGDLVDVLIVEQHGEKSRIYKYKALKILAIDGITKFESKKDKNGNDSLFGGLGSVGGLLAPKNVTLEIKESMVEEMLKRAGNTGVILSLRSQSEEVKHAGEEVEEEESDVVRSALLTNIIEMNRLHAAEALKTSQVKREMDEKNLSMLMSNMGSMGGNSSADALIEAQKRKESEERNLSMIMKNISSVAEADYRNGGKGQLVKNKKTGKYEIVSGKVVGKEEELGKTDTVVIYRKLKADEIQFDSSGKKIENTNLGLGYENFKEGSNRKD